MPITNYYSVNGRLIGEKVGTNARIDYLPDALGNVVGTMNQSSQLVNTYRYKPYGAQLAKTGAGADPSFWWVGQHGYRQTGKKYSDVYVRARHDDSLTGRWTTRDPLWPSRMEYTYCQSAPIRIIDPSGLLDTGIGFMPGPDYWPPITECKITWNVNYPLPGNPCDKPIWAVGRRKKACNPNVEPDRSELESELIFAVCMRMCECDGQAPGWCARALPNYIWTRPNCGGGRGGSGGGVVVAKTCCDQDRCMGGCYSWTYYGPAYNNLGGCMQICFERHEYSHRQDCRSNDPGKAQMTECAAYTESVKCIGEHLGLTQAATQMRWAEGGLLLANRTPHLNARVGVRDS